MGRTSYRCADCAAAANRAKLHARIDGKWVAKHERRPDAQVPAGGASSTARNLARWLRLPLDDGRFGGKPVIAAEALGETFRPQAVSAPAKTSDDRIGLYGPGWNVGRDAAGRLTLGHSGAFHLDAATCVTLVPAEKLGIVVLTNGALTGVPEAVALSFRSGSRRQTRARLVRDRGARLRATGPAGVRDPRPLREGAGRHVAVAAGRELRGRLPQ
jgi:CubicO group peptidase (beta-lactamase class C family)